MAEVVKSGLYIIPTPIGNLDDMTYRAVKILRQVDIVACEDTRVSGKLLHYFKIDKPKISYHEHNEDSKLDYLVSEMLQGKSIGLISDAGMPLISDPGFPLVRHCRENNINVVALPGASAFVTALAASGMPCHEFIFKGFVPSSKTRTKFLKSLIKENRTVVVYESPHKMKKLIRALDKLKTYDFRICLAREITKKFEEYTFHHISDLSHKAGEMKFRGEYVVILDLYQKK